MKTVFNRTPTLKDCPTHYCPGCGHGIAHRLIAEVIDELDRQTRDYWLPKPRLSAFFQTGLDQWLRKEGVTLCAVGGIATNFCVLATVLEAVCYDFKAVLLEDCTAAASISIHKQTLAIYRRTVLDPLLKVSSSADLMAEMEIE